MKQTHNLLLETTSEFKVFFNSKLFLKGNSGRGKNFLNISDNVLSKRLIELYINVGNYNSGRI